MAKDYTLEKRKLVIGGVAIVIVIIYIMRLFVLQIMTDTYKKKFRFQLRIRGSLPDTERPQLVALICYAERRAIGRDLVCGDDLRRAAAVVSGIVRAYATN